MKEYKIVFEPSGRSGLVSNGTTVLDAAKQLGVGLESVCGGLGTCGKCLVQIEEGFFSKHNLHSSFEHLTAMTPAEATVMQRLGLSNSHRLACEARIMGEVLVTIPEASRPQKQVIRKNVTSTIMPVDPVIELYHIKLAPPQLGDRSEQERVLTTLQEVGLGGVKFAYPALLSLAKILRQGNWEITVTVWDKSLILRVQPGFCQQPLGLAVDIGSTTLAAYLCDLEAGAIVATASAMNPQVTYGDDIMSRISYVSEQPAGLARLHQVVIDAINDLAVQATAQVSRSVEDIVDIVLVGNSVMHHLLLNLDPSPLGVIPFTPTVGQAIDCFANDLGLRLNPGARAYVLPLEAGFVGADNVAVLLAESPHRQDAVTLIIDVGTNGEIVLGNTSRLLCTSAATGPALEGAQITHGMRAAPGAIERVRIDPQTLAVRFKVIGQDLWSDELDAWDIEARGICGSGILEAVAEMFTAGILESNGRFNKHLSSPRLVQRGRSRAFVIADATQSITGKPIIISQSDVRAIQLAKSAVYVGAKFLMQEFGVKSVDRIVLAGAFGSVLDAQRVMNIGMIPDCDLVNVHSVGNAAGKGACIALLNKAKRQESSELALWVEHINTSSKDEFQDEFVAALAMPHAVDPFPHVVLKQKGDK